LVAIRPATVLLIAAGLLLAPSLVIGTVLSHSAHLNLIWARQFAEQMQAGILYPRWMPDSFDGLGAPTFYFYPPLAYWLDGLVSVVTFDALSVSHRLSITWLLLLWASGLAMYAWLSRETANPKVALVAALAYTIAPYHLFDHYVRGALAEFATYAVLPLLALAILRMSERRRGGLALLAVSYAALLLAHLPTALLASVTLLPLYVLFRAWRLAESRAAAIFVVKCTFGGLLGIGLAAAYLLPAMRLQGWISSDLLWFDFYKVDKWFAVRPSGWIAPYFFMETIAALTAGYALACVAVGLVLFHRRADLRQWAEAACWLAVAAFCLLLLAGVVPWFWQLPELDKVQFPFRMMVLVEFALATAVGLIGLGPKRRSTLYVSAAALGVLAYGASMVGSEAFGNIAFSWKQSLPKMEDAPEYQPAGYPHPIRQAGAVYSNLEYVADVQPVSCAPAAQACSIQPERFGTARLHIESREPTTVTVRRYFFPAWAVEMLPTHQAIAVKGTERRVVSFVAPAGSGDFRLYRAMLPIERWGWIASALSLAGLLLCLALRRFSRP
jgi:hypothetical protein